MRNENVLEAARRRVSFVFDRFNRIVVSVSGGKDSQVLHDIVTTEAARRGRRVEVFFLDQEAEYAGTIEVVDRLMRHPVVDPRWYQVPIRMTNATSHADIWLMAWGEGQEWMRPRSPLAITEAPGAPDRFYRFFPWLESQDTEPTAHFVGVRSRESLKRWRAVAKNPGMDGITWSSKTKMGGSFRFYPLFDWNEGDVWKYLADTDLPYNRVYDRLFALGVPAKRMRVSFLLHEQAFRAVATLQEIEPDTYDRLLLRLRGVHCAALYGADKQVFSADSLPAAHASWHDYREYIIATTPHEKMERFVKRVRSQGDDEATCKEHVRQLLINDWENNVPVRRVSADKLRSWWWDRV